MKNSTHETVSRDDVVTTSDRSFGFLIAAAFVIGAAIDGWRSGHLWPWGVSIAALLLALALVRPQLLNPLNRLWLKFGLLLHRVVNPVVMALLFFGTIWPTGLVMRAMGRDLLRLKRKPDAASYWIARQPPGPLPETMRDQF